MKGDDSSLYGYHQSSSFNEKYCAMGEDTEDLIQLLNYDSFIRKMSLLE
jgi:hypothetical protein